MGLEVYSKEIQLRIVSGAVNSYRHISMTDCSMTFDYHIKQQGRIKELIDKLVNNSSDLFNLYFLLNENGLSNIKNLFYQIFPKIEKKHLESVELSIWDFRNAKKLYY